MSTGERVPDVAVLKITVWDYNTGILKSLPFSFLIEKTPCAFHFDRLWSSGTFPEHQEQLSLS